jgi:hypothetical protein
MKLRASLASAAVVLACVVAQAGPPLGRAQGGPTMLDPSLTVRTLVTGLTTPSSLAFIGSNDLLVLEKNTGKTNGMATTTASGLPSTRRR